MNNSKIKIHIYFDFKEKSGGGNQFLKALKYFFESKGVYEQDPKKADLILFNSHQFIENLISIKRKYQNKIFIHRVDGPIQLYNSLNDERDNIVRLANNLIADATIFQSNWSFEQNKKLKIYLNNQGKVIMNAPNPEIFNNHGRKIIKSNKIRLIATSWSKNFKKGFREYKWLDDNLDFEKYEMIFIGNSPVKFSNIIHLQSMNSFEISKQLKKSDIYITASQNDPCSNSLIEALHCGLPAIYLLEGGHNEIVKKAGLGFEKIEEVPKLLDYMIKNIAVYNVNIDVPNMEDIGNEYLSYLIKIKKSNKSPKKLTLLNSNRLLLLLYKIKFIDFIKSKINWKK